MNPVWTYAIGGIKLMVAEDQLNEAKNYLKLFEEEKRSRYTCPNCNSGNIELISSPKKSANMFSVLFGFLTFSYAMPIKSWKCFNCRAEFKEAVENNDPQIK